MIKVTNKKVKEAAFLKEISFDTNKDVLYQEMYCEGNFVSGKIYLHKIFPICEVYKDGGLCFLPFFATFVTDHKKLLEMKDVFQDIDDLLMQVHENYRITSEKEDDNKAETVPTNQLTNP